MEISKKVKLELDSECEELIVTIVKEWCKVKFISKYMGTECKLPYPTIKKSTTCRDAVLHKPTYLVDLFIGTSLHMRKLT